MNKNVPPINLTIIVGYDDDDDDEEEDIAERELEKSQSANVNRNMLRCVNGTKLAKHLLVPFLDATTQLFKGSCPSVYPSVGPSVPRYFRMTNMANSGGKNTSNDIKINDGDEVVASGVPPRY